MNTFARLGMAWHDIILYSGSLNMYTRQIHCLQVLTGSRLLEELPPDGGEELLPGGDGAVLLPGTHIVPNTRQVYLVTSVYISTCPHHAPRPHLRSTCDQVSQPRHTDHCRLQTGGMAPRSLQHYCSTADLDWYFIRAQPDITLGGWWQILSRWLAEECHKQQTNWDVPNSYIWTTDYIYYIWLLLARFSAPCPCS